MVRIWPNHRVHPVAVLQRRNELRIPPGRCGTEAEEPAEEVERLRALGDAVVTPVGNRPSPCKPVARHLRAPPIWPPTPRLPQRRLFPTRLTRGLRGTREVVVRIPTGMLIPSTIFAPPTERRDRNSGMMNTRSGVGGGHLSASSATARHPKTATFAEPLFVENVGPSIDSTATTDAATLARLPGTRSTCRGTLLRFSPSSPPMSDTWEW